MPKTKYSQDELLAQLSDNALQLLPLFRKQTFHMDVLCKHFDMCVCQLQMLVLLSMYGEMTISQFAEQLNIAKPNITPQVERLCRDGLLERKRGAADKRSVIVSMTALGQKRLYELRAYHADCVRDEFVSLNYRDIRKLSDSLAIISEMMMKR